MAIRMAAAPHHNQRDSCGHITSAPPFQTEHRGEKDDRLEKSAHRRIVPPRLRFVKCIMANASVHTVSLSFAGRSVRASSMRVIARPSIGSSGTVHSRPGIVRLDELSASL